MSEVAVYVNSPCLSNMFTLLWMRADMWEKILYQLLFMGVPRYYSDFIYLKFMS